MTRRIAPRAIPESKTIARNRDWVTRLTFNFSFSRTGGKFAVNEKSLDHSSLVVKMVRLSSEDYVIVRSWPREQGIEKLPENQCRVKVPDEFISSGRDARAFDGFRVFRYGMDGRVIGKMIEKTFYVIAMDERYKAYDHGN